ncbi:hypothetical protein [Tautonia plasticadhaerens]|uniref:Uncharacterized protein n=1 Tax=Tautonia plasticadhaerens TaxID=2527974 RepID=A0A518H1V3_9BACT|nr:hypothetical protein [Tautonia plasticadhaerens]QDV34812.1 hypothetical protein ElP_27090 [Tautonia plasticadhaerens]
MTTREVLNRKAFYCRVSFHIGVAVVLGWIVVITCMIIPPSPGFSTEPEDSWVIGIHVGTIAGGSLLMAASGICSALVLRCPWCNGELTSAVNEAVRIKKLTPNHYIMNLDCVTCCPHCTRLLDEKWPVRGEVEKFPKKSKSWDDELA